MHRAVGFTFIPNPENKPFINHIDCNKLNNNIENLEWCTPSENMIHAVENDRIPFHIGTKSQYSKLSKEDILFIRKNYIPRHKEFGGKALGDRFGVDKSTISAIVLYKRYKDIE